MKRPFLMTCALAATAALSMTSFSSCDLDSAGALGTINDLLNVVSGLDCNSTNAQYQETVRSGGNLLTLDEMKYRMENYPKDPSMAMVLNASAVNKLFRSATNWKFNNSLVEVQFPTIQLGGCSSPNYSESYTGDVDKCVTFLIGAKVPTVGLSIELAAGVPITAVVKGDDPSNETDYARGLRTCIFADLPHMQLVNASLNGFSLDAELPLTATMALSVVGYPGIKKYKDIINSIVWPIITKEAGLRRVSLFDLSAWEMGDKGSIKMVVGNPVVNTEEGTLTLGMYSNIDLGTPDTWFDNNKVTRTVCETSNWTAAGCETSRVTWEESFPKNAEVGLHVHPDLIRGLINLMFYQGHIESDASKSANGSTLDFGSESGSAFKVTLANMKEYPMQTLLTYDPDFAKYFTMGLRMWTLDGLCGFMDILAGFTFKLTDHKFEMGIGNIREGAASGIGVAGQKALQAIRETQTFQDAINFLTISFNYDQFKVPEAKDDENAKSTQIMTDAISFSIDGNGVSLYLNFPDLKCDKNVKDGYCLNL